KRLSAKVGGKPFVIDTSRNGNGPYVPVLRQRRPVADQSGLGARERQVNLAGALVVASGARRLLDEGPVVLVDDLLTTGASLAEAARAVGAAGPAATGAATGLRAAVVAASPSAFEINRN
ncbi:hypothetical protein ABZV68_34050, partial [Streptomyces clavifer]